MEKNNTDQPRNVAKEILVRFLRGLYICALTWLVFYVLWWLGDLAVGAYSYVTSGGDVIGNFLVPWLLMSPIVAVLALAGYWLIMITALILAIALQIKFVSRHQIVAALIGLIAALALLPFRGYFGLYLESLPGVDSVFWADDVIAGMRSFLQFGFPAAMAVGGYYLGRNGDGKQAGLSSKTRRPDAA